MGELNRVVARFLDGRVMKGTTEDFLPNRPRFHLRPTGSTQTGQPGPWIMRTLGGKRSARP